MNSAPVIAIDGPAAAGKGTVARRLAEILQFHYLDSGKIYRAVAAAALARGLPPSDEDAMGALAKELAADNAPPQADLDRPETGEAASCLAKIPAVRAALLPLQRRMQRPPGLVADGRDMGTVVFPDAALKVFLSAKIAVRAERRRRQLAEKGIHATISSVLTDLRQRDRRDRARAGSPLFAAADAIAVDSSRRAAAVIARELAGRYAAARAANFMQKETS